MNRRTYATNYKNKYDDDTLITFIDANQDTGPAQLYKIWITNAHLTGIFLILCSIEYPVYFYLIIDSGEKKVTHQMDARF